MHPQFNEGDDVFIFVARPAKTGVFAGTVKDVQEHGCRVRYKVICTFENGSYLFTGTDSNVFKNFEDAKAYGMRKARHFLCDWQRMHNKLREWLIDADTNDAEYELSEACDGVKELIGNIICCKRLGKPCDESCPAWFEGGHCLPELLSSFQDALGDEEDPDDEG